MSLADRYQSRPAASTDFACEHYDALPDGKRCRHYVRAALHRARSPPQPTGAPVHSTARPLQDEGDRAIGGDYPFWCSLPSQARIVSQASSRGIRGPQNIGAIFA